MCHCSLCYIDQKGMFLLWEAEEHMNRVIQYTFISSHGILQCNKEEKEVVIILTIDDLEERMGGTRGKDNDLALAKRCLSLSHIPQPTQSFTMAPSSFRAKGWDPLLIIAQASRLIIKGE